MTGGNMLDLKFINLSGETKFKININEDDTLNNLINLIRDNQKTNCFNLLINSKIIYNYYRYVWNEEEQKYVKDNGEIINLTQKLKDLLQNVTTITYVREDDSIYYDMFIKSLYDTSYKNSTPLPPNDSLYDNDEIQIILDLLNSDKISLDYKFFILFKACNKKHAVDSIIKIFDKIPHLYGELDDTLKTNTQIINILKNKRFDLYRYYFNE